LFQLDFSGGLFARKYQDPVLVSGTDGVGTKLKVAQRAGIHNTVGIDLVGMCVNDVLCCGAEPLFFLDYVAMSKDDPQLLEQIVSGISDGCIASDMALVGGETAIMPDMYQPGDYDLAGFCVGVVERDRIIQPTHVRPGDVLLGVASSGPHSNGYSLVRRTVKISGAALDAPFADRTLGAALLEPTRIYVKTLLSLGRKVQIHALAHITGGGLLENIPRVLPEGCEAVIDLAAWERAAVFRWLQDQGGVAETEMLRTFNCGIGMVVCVAEADADRAAAELTAHGETVHRIGWIAAAGGAPRVRVPGIVE
jgi:phosphoribosylformylglycinamidine cyclo-ligase